MLPVCGFGISVWLVGSGGGCIIIMITLCCHVSLRIHGWLLLYEKLKRGGRRGPLYNRSGVATDAASRWQGLTDR